MWQQNNAINQTDETVEVKYGITLDTKQMTKVN